MAETFLKIPQIGEGLQEARIVALLKQPGDMVRRDDIIYQMETDKAVMDVESPAEGTLVRWLVKPDDVVPIGGDVLVLDSKPSSGSLTKVPFCIPQIGEGLQEARLVAVLKQPGDAVAKDEAIYQMETDKAVMDVESPYAGTLVQWSAAVDSVLPIGAEVGIMEVADGTAAAAAAPAVLHAPSAPRPEAQAAGAADRRRDISPRTRAYAKEKGVSEDQLGQIPAAGAKLMPADIDAFLSARPAKPQAGKPFVESPLSSRQRVLSSRLVRGSQMVVPGMMSAAANWSAIEELRAFYKSQGGEFQPSAFTMFAYCVAKATASHPIMRSTLVGDSTVRTYEHVQLGIAVALPGDDLVLAVVEDADTLSWPEFAEHAREKIRLARGGKDQANESVTLSITNMQGHSIREAMAVVVPPGVATIFLGEAHNALAQHTTELKLQRTANIGITIDHRLINGVGGAEFLNAIRANVEDIRGLIQP